MTIIMIIIMITMMIIMIMTIIMIIIIIIIISLLLLLLMIIIIAGRPRRPRAYYSSLSLLSLFIIIIIVRVSAAVILHVVYRRGCDVVIPTPPLDTYLVKGCPNKSPSLRRGTLKGVPNCTKNSLVVPGHRVAKVKRAGISTSSGTGDGSLFIIISTSIIIA